MFIFIQILILKMNGIGVVKPKHTWLMAVLYHQDGGTTWAEGTGLMQFLTN